MKPADREQFASTSGAQPRSLSVFDYLLIALVAELRLDSE